VSAGRRTVTSLFADGHEGLEDPVRHAKPSTTAGYVERLGRRPEAVARRAAAVLEFLTDRLTASRVQRWHDGARSRGSPNPAARRPGRTEDASNRSQAVARWPRPAPVHRPGPRGAAGEHLLVVSHRPKARRLAPGGGRAVLGRHPLGRRGRETTRRRPHRGARLCAGVVPAKRSRSAWSTRSPWTWCRSCSVPARGTSARLTRGTCSMIEMCSSRTTECGTCGTGCAAEVTRRGRWFTRACTQPRIGDEERPEGCHPSNPFEHRRS
jgi:hypothetical protein